MSLVTRESRISVKKFAAVPALLNLQEIQRPPASVSQASSFEGPGGVIDLAEGCILTKSVKYTHQLVYWVNPVDHGDLCLVEDIINELGIIPYVKFTLDDPCNLAYLEAFVHTSLDVYAFVAVTASSSTLADLLEMVKSDNQHRQQEMNARGYDTGRSLSFTSSSFTNPEYELIAIHPEHFLPGGSLLTIYHPSSPNPTCKHYVAARDRCLRESVEPNSPCLPSFRLPETRVWVEQPNVFLVILNAQIKFRRYLDMIQVDPPAMPLPVEVISLMHRTIELVDLLYWLPVPAKGSRGEQVFASRQRNRGQNSRPDATKIIESGSSKAREMAVDEMKTEMDKDGHNHSNAWASVSHRRFHWPAHMNLEARVAYGMELMRGPDCDYDPTLFENFPINYAPDKYTERPALEAWRQAVSSENE